MTHIYSFSQTSRLPVGAGMVIRAALCSLFASGAMAAIAFLLGINLPLLVGQMLLGSAEYGPHIYFAGGIAHFSIGFVFALLYAGYIAETRGWCAVTKGLAYGVVLTGLSIVAFPLVAWVCVQIYGMPLAAPWTGLSALGGAAGPFVEATYCALMAHIAYGLVLSLLYGDP